MLCSDKLVPPPSHTTTTIAVLGPDGFAAGKKRNRAKKREENEIGDPNNIQGSFFAYFAALANLTATTTANFQDDVEIN